MEPVCLAIMILDLERQNTKIISIVKAPPGKYLSTVIPKRFQGSALPKA
jgi:hypothetical protein